MATNNLVTVVRAEYLVPPAVAATPAGPEYLVPRPLSAVPGAEGPPPAYAVAERGVPVDPALDEYLPDFWGATGGLW